MLHLWYKTDLLNIAIQGENKNIILEILLMLVKIKIVVYAGHKLILIIIYIILKIEMVTC